VFVNNSHNYEPSFNPAVNGKTHNAVWCPSRDDAGNGTTTLTDLVGSSNGTLTNMDAATDWVADTGAGGVRALDFDGVNDFVLDGSSLSLGNKFSISIWANMTSDVASQLIGKLDLGQNKRSWGIERLGGAWRLLVNNTGINTGNTTYDFTTSANAGTWQHLLFVWDGTQSNGNRGKLWINTSSISVSAIQSDSDKTPVTNDVPITIACRRNSGVYQNFWGGRLDDIRIWNGDAFDGTDAADLYAAQRGGDAS
jgi:hypothetical protein